MKFGTILKKMKCNLGHAVPALTSCRRKLVWLDMSRTPCVVTSAAVDSVLDNCSELVTLKVASRLLTPDTRDRLVACYDLWTDEDDDDVVVTGGGVLAQQTVA